MLSVLNLRMFVQIEKLSAPGEVYFTGQLDYQKFAGRFRQTFPSLDPRTQQIRPDIQPVFKLHTYRHLEARARSKSDADREGRFWRILSKIYPSNSVMADKSKPSTLAVYLYVPNLIGYMRILMNCFAFAICFKNKYLFSVLYFVSFVCDALDGWFARKLNQVSTFGAVLDMVTDRISTACLLVILSQVYRPGLIFLSLLALDIASHWLQMYSSFLVGKSSHKDVKDSSSWLFKLYYGNRKFMGYCCISCEVLHILLFLLAKNQTENLTEVLVNAATQSGLLMASLILILFGWAIKQLVNVIQMKTAADACILYDISKKQ